MKWLVKSISRRYLFDRQFLTGAEMAEFGNRAANFTRHSAMLHIFAAYRLHFYAIFLAFLLNEMMRYAYVSRRSLRCILYCSIYQNKNVN